MIVSSRTLHGNSKNEEDRETEKEQKQERVKMEKSKLGTK